MKPATPLPWVVERRNGYVRIAEACEHPRAVVGATETGRNGTDIAYLAHAANAYSRLIDLARSYAKQEDAAYARALLKELGE